MVKVDVKYHWDVIWVPPPPSPPYLVTSFFAILWIIPSISEEVLFYLTIFILDKETISIINLACGSNMKID
jgi:hypothetical protein